MLPILLIGATGPMGRAVLDRAVPDNTGTPVRAFARSPEALADVGVDVVRGDVLDRDSLIAALEGTSGVISVLGSRPTSKDAHLLEEGTANIIAAMAETGIRRLVCVTGMGAGSSRGHGPWWYDRIVRPTILRGVYADKDRQETLIREADLDATIVRPAVLSDKPHSATVRAVVDLAPGEKMGSITRRDVADFLLAESLTGTHIGQTVHLFT